MITCKCGAQLPDGAKFCTKCGASITPAPTNNNATFVNPQVNYQNGNFNNAQGTYGNGTSAYSPSKGKGKPNIIGIIAGVLLIIFNFLPYATAMGESCNFREFTGQTKVVFIFFLIVGIAAIVVSLLGLDKVVLGTGVVAFVLAVYEMIYYSKEVGDYGAFIHRGFGFYLMVIGAVALLAAMPVWNAITKKK